MHPNAGYGNKVHAVRYQLIKGINKKEHNERKTDRWRCASTALAAGTKTRCERRTLIVFRQDAIHSFNCVLHHKAKGVSVESDGVARHPAVTGGKHTESHDDSIRT